MAKHKSFEHLHKDAAKDAKGYVKIRVRLYSNDKRFEYGGDVYACVLAKPIPLPSNIIDDFSLNEIKRLNLTLWRFEDIPNVKAEIGSVAGIYLCYFNGAERAWKPNDESIDCDTTGIADDELDSTLEFLANETPTYEPHNDSVGNYGDESVHAVYDKLNKLKLDWHN